MRMRSLDRITPSSTQPRQLCSFTTSRRKAMPVSGGCSASISFFPAPSNGNGRSVSGGSPDDRLAAEYDFEISFSFDEAQRECRRAREFIERIRRYLIENGLTGDDLGKEADVG